MIDSSIGAGERHSFEAELDKLEMKYLEKYVNNVKNFIPPNKPDGKIDAIHTKLQRNEYQWWLNALQCNEHDLDSLLWKIQSVNK